MVMLPGLAVVFVGIAGGNSHVDRQVGQVLRDVHVEHVSMSSSDIRTLARHREGSRELVRKLHSDGVISGELVDAKLRIVVYRGDGSFKSLSESQLAGRSLGASELSVLSSNLTDEVHALQPAHEDVPDIEVDAPPPPAPAKQVAVPVRTALVAPKKQPPPKKAEPPKKVEPPTPAKQDLGDDEMPSNLAPARRVSSPQPPQAAVVAKPVPPPVAPKPTPPPAAAPESEAPRTAAPKEVAEADDAGGVSADEVAALMGGAAGANGASEASVTATADHALHLRASAGFGIATRNFEPGPATIAGYASAPVGSLELAARVQPLERVTMGVVFDTAVGMTTPVAEGSAPTSMQRWEVAGSYSLVHGSFDLAATLGFGRRAFAIRSTDPARSPDGDYNYLVVGAVASAELGSRVTLHGFAAFQPVVSGTEMTESAFGEASRWALDVGAAVEMRLMSHLFVRAAADYQRFAWAWDGAGARGAGGAVDAYPSGTLSLGADY